MIYLRGESGVSAHRHALSPSSASPRLSANVDDLDARRSSARWITSRSARRPYVYLVIRDDSCRNDGGAGKPGLRQLDERLRRSALARCHLRNLTSAPGRLAPGPYR
jgi:hypothetical protein